METTMTDAVFVAHDAGDAWIAQRMATEIMELGAEVFVDVLDIEAGDDFEQRIIDAARRADELVVLLTPWSLHRLWIWLEIGMFLALGKRIVGVLYRLNAHEIRNDADVPTTVARLELIDLNGFDDYLAEVSRRIDGCS